VSNRFGGPPTLVRPDVDLFPDGAWLRATTSALAALPADRLDYIDSSIWAGIVSHAATIPAQIQIWDALGTVAVIGQSRPSASDSGSARVRNSRRYSPNPLELERASVGAALGGCRTNILGPRAGTSTMRLLPRASTIDSCPPFLDSLEGARQQLPTASRRGRSSTPGRPVRRSCKPAMTRQDSDHDRPPTAAVRAHDREDGEHAPRAPHERARRHRPRLPRQGSPSPSSPAAARRFQSQS
jgi:hypothetical protein